MKSDIVLVIHANKAPYTDYLKIQNYFYIKGGLMPIDVLFVHSAGSQSGDQGSAPFVAHLRKSLGTDYNVTAPIMPDPDAPSYKHWKQELEKLFASESPAIIIGHSLGGSVLLKYFAEEKPDISAIGLFVVATPFWGRDGWDAEEFLLPENFSKSLPCSLNIFLYQSQDDDVVSIAHLSYYSSAIPQAKTRILNGYGHVFRNGMPELVNDIKLLKPTNKNS